MRRIEQLAKGLKMDQEVADAMAWLDKMEAEAVERGHVESATEFHQLVMLALVYRLSSAPTHVHLAPEPPQLDLELDHHQRTDAAPPSGWQRLEAVAEQLGVSKRTVRNMVGRGQLERLHAHGRAWVRWPAQVAQVPTAPAPAPDLPPGAPEPAQRHTRAPHLALWKYAGPRLYQLDDLARQLGCNPAAVIQRHRIGQLVAHRQSGGGVLYQVLPLDAPGRWQTLGELRHVTGLKGKRLAALASELECWQVHARWRVYRAKGGPE